MSRRGREDHFSLFVRNVPDGTRYDVNSVIETTGLCRRSNCLLGLLRAG